MAIRQVPCTSDAECIALFLKGNERCFTQLVKRHHSQILRYINSYLNDWQQSKDILQNVLMDFVLLLRSGKYVEQGKVYHLLISMAHNRIHEYFRAQHRHSVFLPLSEVAHQQPEELAQEEEWQPTRSEMLRLHACLRAMKERKRAIFMKRYHGVPYEKIARTMGISSDAAKVQFYRTVKKLRKLFKGR
jgi:RNA polymerase sigma factor (sigma-70 family)